MDWGESLKTGFLLRVKRMDVLPLHLQSWERAFICPLTQRTWSTGTFFLPKRPKVQEITFDGTVKEKLVDHGCPELKEFSEKKKVSIWG